MDPLLEQRLRDEVLYLHSLFHQSPISNPPQSTILHPINPTNFKKPKKKPPKFNKSRKPKKIASFSGNEWPVNPLSDVPPATQSGWPELKLKPKTQTTRLPTPQELEKHNWNQVQIRALNATKEFYSKIGDDSDEEDDDDDDAMEYDDDDMGDGDNVFDKEYDFFWKMFSEDEELKGSYVKYCGGGGLGEFLCLVCSGVNEKNGKRFKDCVALVQHSVSIAKTKKRRSHRAYGKVVCRVLEWDIDRLPSSIVTDHKCGQLQGNDVNVDKDVNIAACNLNEIVNNGNLIGEGHIALETVDGESMVCEDFSVVANVEEENNRNQVLNESEGSTRGTVNNLCRNLSSTMVLEAAPEGK